MKIRGFTRVVLVTTAFALLCVPVVVAQRAFAQETSGLEPTGDAPSASPTPTSEPASSAASANPTGSAEEDIPLPYDDKPATDGDAPPPGTEVRVIVAGETEAAAAYAAGDSVTGFNAADMEALGALSIADLAGFTPNLEIVTTGATTPTFFIRGVGLNDFSANASGAVAIFQDDVNINAPAMQLGTIFDMENVVIQRGPVGTGAARNASAGAIRLFSRKPRGSYNGFLRSTFGNYNFNDFEGAIEAPIYEDILLGRIAFRSSYRDGYQTNGCGGMTAYPGFRPNNSPGNANDPAWSYCGENVPYPGQSLGEGNGISTGFTPLPLNLPTKVNNLGTWATRATLRFQPTLDQDWLLNGHVANRDEYTRLGIQYGTKGQQVYPDGSTIDGILGGLQGTSSTEFVRPQVTQMIQQLTQLYRIPLAANCPTTGNCPNRVFSTAAPAARIAVANDIAANLDTDPYTGYYDRVGDTTNLVYGGYLSGEIALPAELTFKTVSGYDAYTRTIDGDTDQSPNVIVEIASQDQGWQYYQNFDLSGALDVSPIEWNVGGYFLYEDLHFESDVNFGQATGLGIGDRQYVQTAWSFGVYAGLEWSFWDDFTLDGGIRYNWEDKFIDYFLRSSTTPVTAERTEVRSAPTGEIRLTYNFTQDAHAYWKYTRGWKGGQFNATGSLTDGVTYAEPEENNAYETGLRAAWFDNRVGLNLSIFYYDYSNYQLFTVQNSAGATPEFVVINANDVQVYGSEITLDTRPWDNTRLQARFGWLESYFIDFVNKNFVNQADPSNVGPELRRVRDLNYSGNRLVNSPEFKISLTAEQTVQLGRYGALTARYDTAWTDTTYFDPSEGRGLPNKNDQTFLPEYTIGQQPYWLHNLLFIYRPPTGNWALELFVRNVSDQVYRTFSFDATVFANTTIHYTGEPRMFGGTLSVNF